MSHETPTPQPTAAPRKPWRRIAIATLVAGAVAGLGFKAYAHGGPWGGGCGARGWHASHGPGAMDPEAMKRRTDGMVRWMLADVNATEAQQERITAIVSATMTELAPLRQKHFEARKQAAEILSKPSVDRAALETLRTQEMAAADQVSKRITQSIADAADVLSPDQRAQLVERMQRMRGRWPS
ncbi:MAG: Spy/CpxP family protein refolding chaperone [Burkholderiales bacterium]|jgi:Spy/CpxP family protein refolding chaperone|nr:Spy/CpxP family protein refolding chaperone [Burkholderiales bacterium]